MNATASAARPLDAERPFDPARQRLECIGRTAHGADVASFRFRPEGGGVFRYLPGQYVTIEAPLPGGTETRTFTASSSPSRPYALELTVKAGPQSRVARWMIDALRPGMHIKATAPLGRFALTPESARRPLLFVSGGSGATPVMSMLRWLHDCEPGADVVYLHAARRPDDILFRLELELIAAAMPRLALGFLVAERAGMNGWGGFVGQMDAARLALLAPDAAGREVYCCGPAGFMDAVRESLLAMGVPAERYHQESFGAVPDAAAEAAAVAAAPPEGAPIRFTETGREARAAPGQTVLQAARAAGVRISAACEQGLCGTCKVACEGPVDMRHNGGILDEEIAEGFILACCSRPLGPLVVEA